MYISLRFSAVTLPLLLAGQSQDAELRIAKSPRTVEVISGPTVLHSDLFIQWGGHTFGYVIEGKHGVFWSGTRGRTGPALIGQFPRPGSALPVLVVELPLPDLPLDKVVHPQMIRTPDGYLHVFLGFEPQAENRGEIRYFRSVRPEDVSGFVDVSHRIPKTKYATFASARKNVGIGRRGERAVLVAMTAHAKGKYLRNTPLAFFGKRDGLDFSFEEPVVFGAPKHFFYPQVLVTDTGPVLVGNVTYEPSTSRHCELVHLGWDGRVLLWEKLPRPEGLVTAYSNEMEPLDTEWSKLLMVREIAPRERDERTLEFWLYDTQERKLELRRSWDFDASRADSLSASGQLLIGASKAPVFLNDPGSRAIYAWEGDLIGRGPLHVGPLARTETRAAGLGSIRSVFVPSIVHGSVPFAGERAVAVDVMHPAATDGQYRPCAMLLWRIRY